MQENQKKAFDFAADLTKQLITLSTGIITLTVTFSKDVFGAASSAELGWLVVTWFLFFVSIVLGLLTLMALTGNLDPMPTRVTDDQGNVTEVPTAPVLSINGSNVLSTSKAQIVFFLLALVTTGIYGFVALRTPAPPKADAPIHCCANTHSNP